MLKVKVHAVYLILSVVVGFAILLFAFKGFKKNDSEIAGVRMRYSAAKNEACAHNSLRLNGYTYIRPLMGAEKECESIAKYSSLKNELTAFIDYEKNKGTLAEASVYLADCTNDDWMGINPAAVYTPGSLLKLVTLIAYLRLAETKPGILEEEIEFKKNGNQRLPTQSFNSNTVKEGNKYKIKELLQYMIAYSDNSATMLLHKYIDVGMFQKVFSDLGFRIPDMRGSNFQMSAKEYSKFMRVLYDGGYLTFPASEYAVSLLAECDFNAGIVSGLPTTVKVAHKFGQAGTPERPELHESAIIYMNKGPYVLTIMTRGMDVKKQARVIGQISKIVYDNMTTCPI